jgi:hypothetical protein
MRSIVALVLVAACGGAPPPAAQAPAADHAPAAARAPEPAVSCDGVGAAAARQLSAAPDHPSERQRRLLSLGDAMVRGIVAECVNDHWSDDAKRCFAANGTGQGCPLTPAQQKSLGDRLLAAMPR